MWLFIDSNNESKVDEICVVGEGFWCDTLCLLFADVPVEVGVIMWA